MKRESLIGFCLFASFLYGINNILKITFNVKDKTKSEELLLEGPCRSELQLGKVTSKEQSEQTETDDNEQSEEQTETDELLLEGSCRSELQLGKVTSKVGPKSSDINEINEINEINDDGLDKINIIINEINIIEFGDDKNDDDDKKNDILESSMIRTIENEREFSVFTINDMIDKKKYLIELNDKLTDIKTSLTNLKNEMEFCNSTTFYL